LAFDCIVGAQFGGGGACVGSDDLYDASAILIRPDDRQGQVALLPHFRAPGRRNGLHIGGDAVERRLRVRLGRQWRFHKEAHLVRVRPGIPDERQAAIIGERQRFDHLLAGRKLKPALRGQLDRGPDHGEDFVPPLLLIPRVAADRDLLHSKIGDTPETDRGDRFVVAICFAPRGGHDDLLAARADLRQRRRPYARQR
jgi:hypothetical protein